MQSKNRFESKSIKQLLREQSVPASIGILIMSLYGIIDTVFVGKYIGKEALAAVSIIKPIVIIYASLGMAIGLGGVPLLTEKLVDKNQNEVQNIFVHQIILLIVVLAALFVLNTCFITETLRLFGAKAEILQPAIDYFKIVVPSLPFFTFAIFSTVIMRLDDAPKTAMLVMIVPAILNLILDPLFILYFNWAIKGAAWATNLGYLSSAIYALYYFTFKSKNFKLLKSIINLKWVVFYRIIIFGAPTLFRHTIISIFSIIINYSLFSYGSIIAVSTYGIIQRIMMFFNFPINGIVQGFIPIVGYNYKLGKWKRVLQSILLSIKYGLFISVFFYVLIMVFAREIAELFTDDKTLIHETVMAIRMSFIGIPLILPQLISSAYFQAIGKAKPALLLTITKQGFLLIPLVLIFPMFIGLNGIWLSFPIADLLAASICLRYLNKELKKTTNFQ